ncbi:helix-turn-helix transcriptional regulator [uncultured Cocleimonas sp.]|uniref:helix-turn-helix transcriptional regulator n=1 Tax=uncultured Cocleimonas sp. TaxID=1051587 RepID=UPI00263384AA|nr:helix-turn-helix transcriptional regulator [uncultured Cocleimonas sp.]
MFKNYNKEILLIVIFTVVVLASGADFIADVSYGADTKHIIKEAVVVISSVIAIALLMISLKQQKSEIISLRQDLQASNKTNSKAQKYVIDARKKLGNVITQQFSEWMLTNSETEVGWLLLKGLSLKEIAIIRETKEKTVRQQASSIYKKSGVNGRHEFSAWFIEDIL